MPAFADPLQCFDSSSGEQLTDRLVCQVGPSLHGDESGTTICGELLIASTELVFVGSQPFASRKGMTIA